MKSFEEALNEKKNEKENTDIKELLIGRISHQEEFDWLFRFIRNEKNGKK